MQTNRKKYLEYKKQKGFKKRSMAGNCPAMRRRNHEKTVLTNCT